MVLISTSVADSTTTEVQRWLKSYQIPNIRINNTDKVTIDEIIIESGVAYIKILISSRVDRFSIDLSAVKHYWYRRGEIKVNSRNVKTDDFTYPELFASVANNLETEYESVSRFLNNYLDNKSSINSFYDNDLSKLSVLRKASEVGILVPKTLITTNKIALSKFSIDCPKLITKAIWNSFSVEIANAGLFDHHQPFLFDHRQPVQTDHP